jgi:hypothetical protein
VTLQSRNFPDPTGAARILSFLEQDFAAVAQSASAGSSAESLSPLDVSLTKPVSCDLYGPKNPTVIKIASWVTKANLNVPGSNGSVDSTEVETCYSLVATTCNGRESSCKNGPIDPQPR